MSWNYTRFWPFLLIAQWTAAQIPEKVFDERIRTVQLFPVNNPLGLPMIPLGAAEQLELHFDDLGGGVRNYAYTFQLCNADWTPAMLSHFDFIRGFSQVRLTNYRNSSVALTRYTHYQARIPDRNCMPSRAGNYILKVFLDGDTTKLVLTRRVLVYREGATVAAQVQQPFDGRYFHTHQKLQFRINLPEGLDIPSPQQQVRVVLLQNGRWDNARMNLRPTLYARKTLEYNTESDAVFAAGKEWRWLDLRSFRLQSDRVSDASYRDDGTDIFVKPDGDRSRLPYAYYRDANGRFLIQTTESVNPLWQGDYARVHFRYLPEGGREWEGKTLYLFGALTDYGNDPAARMRYNAEEGVYETSLLLKQGYYDYAYVTVDDQDRSGVPSFSETEGNVWETENEYQILVYFRPLAGRADELIGISRLQSLQRR